MGQSMKCILHMNCAPLAAIEYQQNIWMVRVTFISLCQLIFQYFCYFLISKHFSVQVKKKLIKWIYFLPNSFEKQIFSNSNPYTNLAPFPPNCLFFDLKLRYIQVYFNFSVPQFVADWMVYAIFNCIYLSLVSRRPLLTPHQLWTVRHLWHLLRICDNSRHITRIN